MFKARSFLVVIGLVGCSALAEPHAFKLYDEPHHKVDPNCDVYTQLVLDVTDGKGTAEFSEKLGGTCQLPVNPNPRTYQIELKGRPCGSKSYGLVDASENEVEILDHTTRLCKDVVEAKFVVSEKQGDKPWRVYYTEF